MACDFAFHMMLTSYFRASKKGMIPRTIWQELADNYKDIGLEAQYEAEDVVLAFIEDTLLVRPEFAGCANYDVSARISRIPKKLCGKRKYVHTISFLSCAYVFDLKPSRDERGTLHIAIEMKEARDGSLVERFHV